jgi:hypothetical protein
MVAAPSAVRYAMCMPDAKQARTAESAGDIEDSGLATSRSGQIQDRVPELELEIEKIQSRQVLMQRVIVLNNAHASIETSPTPRAVVVGAEPFASTAIPVKSSPPLLYKQHLDLAATALEWGAQRLGTKPEPAPATITAAEPPSVQNTEIAKDSPDAQWATYSSIELQPCDELLPSQRVLRANIEDAITKQYSPLAAAPAVTDEASITDLASLDCALESAGVLQAKTCVPTILAPPLSEPALPEPAKVQMFVVPASLVWTVLGVLVVFALLLAYLAAAFLVCRAPSAFDVRSVRCVQPADVVKLP